MRPGNLVVLVGRTIDSMLNPAERFAAIGFVFVSARTMTCWPMATVRAPIESTVAQDVAFYFANVDFVDAAYRLRYDGLRPRRVGGTRGTGFRPRISRIAQSLIDATIRLESREVIVGGTGECTQPLKCSADVCRDRRHCCSAVLAVVRGAGLRGDRSDRKPGEREIFVHRIRRVRVHDGNQVRRTRLQRQRRREAWRIEELRRLSRRKRDSRTARSYLRGDRESRLTLLGADGRDDLRLARSYAGDDAAGVDSCYRGIARRPSNRRSDYDAILVEHDGRGGGGLDQPEWPLGSTSP